jgi:hypothetical protein
MCSIFFKYKWHPPSSKYVYLIIYLSYLRANANITLLYHEKSPI